MTTPRYTHVVCADLECCGAGSIWELHVRDLVRYFDTAKAARQHLKERKDAAGISVQTEEEIIESTGLEGGDPYIFSYLYMRYPRSQFPTQQLVEAQFDVHLEEFLNGGVGSPYVVEQESFEV